MPPSPIITASVNEQMFKRLLAELDDIFPPKIIFKTTSGGKGVYGQYRAGTVWLYMVAAYDSDQLRFVASELSRTLLHETRHHWQHLKHPEWFEGNQGRHYSHQKTEIDAFEFEDTRLHDYRTLVRVSRKFPSTPFSRLAKTEKSLR